MFFFWETLDPQGLIMFHVSVDIQVYFQALKFPPEDIWIF